MIDFYNEQVRTSAQPPSKDPRRISWSQNLLRDFERGREARFVEGAMIEAYYRPFMKQHLYYDRQLIWSAFQLPRVFPANSAERNLCIVTSGPGSSQNFAAIMIDASFCYDLLPKANAYPRFVVGNRQEESLYPGDMGNGSLTRWGREAFRARLSTDVSDDDIFHYVYGVLHSPDFRALYGDDLRKTSLKVPVVASIDDFYAFAEAGRALSGLHVDYESVPPFPLEELESPAGSSAADPYLRYAVRKMRFAAPSSTLESEGLNLDRSSIAYSSTLTLAGIPEEAYRYMLGSRSAIEWIMDRYQVRTDKASGIVNDPNNWSREHGQPRYILDLLRRIVTVSVETMKIVDNLPPLDIVGDPAT